MTFHGWEGVYPIRWSAKLQRRLANWLSRGSIHVGSSLQDFYGDTPDVIVFGGVDERRWPVIQSASFSSKKINVAFIGRLSLENDIADYISLLELLHQQGKQVSMTWIGDGPLREQAERIGTVTGMIDDPIKELAKQDLVFASSYLSLLEAQALGKITIALYSHAFKEAYLKSYPGSAWLILASQPEQAVQQLTQLTSNPAQLKQWQTAMSSFARAQTWSSISDTYYRLWRQK